MSNTMASPGLSWTAAGGRGRVPYTSKGYMIRAEECVRLANLTQDKMIQRELLSLRQSYLKTAERLVAIEGQPAQVPTRE